MIEERRYVEARAEVQMQTRAAPNDDAALHCMGRLLLEQGEPAQAVGWLEKAVKVRGKNALHHLWLGNALGTSAEKASIVRQPFIARRFKAELELAVSLDPTLVDAHRGLVMFHSMAPGAMGGSRA